MKGTSYEADCVLGASEDDDEDGVRIKWADNDCWKFCHENLVLAYLWGYLEEIHLTTFATQNIERIGLVDGKVGKARDVTGPSRSSHKNRNQIFEK